MKYYQTTTRFNCGIDLHARQMYVCVVDRQGKKLLHQNIQNNDFAFFLALYSMHFWAAPIHHESRSWKVGPRFSLLPPTRLSPNGCLAGSPPSCPTEIKRTSAVPVAQSRPKNLLPDSFFPLLPRA